MATLCALLQFGNPTTEHQGTILVKSPQRTKLRLIKVNASAIYSQPNINRRREAGETEYGPVKTNALQAHGPLRLAPRQ
jgi:hypothetical protein